MTTDVVECDGCSKFGGITAEVIVGNIGPGSVSAGCVKGHWAAPAALDKTLMEKAPYSKVTGVEAYTICLDAGKGYFEHH